MNAQENQIKIEKLEALAQEWKKAQYDASQTNNAAGVMTAVKELEWIYREIDLLRAGEQPEEPAHPDMRATINWQDGALRLYCEDRVSKEDYKALRDQDFGHRRGETTFKAAYTVGREKFLLERFGLELEEDDTDIIEEAEARAERYENRSDKAHQEYQSRHDTAHKMAEVIPFGQPILVGHHSEGRDRRYRARIENNFRKAFEAADKSKYWQQRAESALRRVENRETAPAIHRRIDGLETELRKMQRDLEKYAPKHQDFYGRWIWFYENRLAFERALLAALPEEQKPLDRSTFKKGGAFNRGGTWYVIDRVNQKTLSYTSFDLSLKRLITDILPGQYLSPEEFAAAEKVQTHGGGYIIKALPAPVVTETAIVPVSERVTVKEATFRYQPKPAYILTPIQRQRLEKVLSLERTLKVEVCRNEFDQIRFNLYGILTKVQIIALRDGELEATEWRETPVIETLYPQKVGTMNMLYTIGYAGLDRDQFVQVAKANGWLVVDSRIKPVSRGGIWNKNALLSALGIENYLHIEQLGNRNYKTGGEVALVDAEFGIKAVVRLLDSRTVVLLCGCADLETCHRKHIAELVSGEIPGLQVHHLSKKEVQAMAAPATPAAPQTPPVQAEAPAMPEKQLGLPGIGKDKSLRVQSEKPVQLSMFSADEMTGKPSNAFETGGKLTLIREEEPRDLDAEARDQTEPLV